MCHCYYHWSFYYDAAKQTNKETQNMMKSQRNVTYHKNKKKKHNRHQHNTDDGGQAMGEEMRHVQMSR